jgi:pyruvate/2-oxoglutarate/acetoin dehydrogenase E1 component
MREITYVQSLNDALLECFETDDNVFLIGEDITDPYGGAFKVSKNLSSKYPDRVITTPISEACFVGIGAGMAMRGLKPIVEIMFGDFISIAADQIVNHIAKFRQMYKNGVEVPFVLRTPMGGGRGYGPTHSQCLEKMFLGIPGLRIVSPSHFHDPGALLKHVTLDEKEPVIFIEAKRLYPQKLRLESNDVLSIENECDDHGYPVSIVRNFQKGLPDVLIITYGGQSPIIENVLVNMNHDEINLICCLPSLVSHVPLSTIMDLVKSCGRVIIIEEGAGPFGWSAEITAVIYTYASNSLLKPIKRITALDSVIPAARHLEEFVLPNAEIIEASIEEILL